MIKIKYLLVVTILVSTISCKKKDEYYDYQTKSIQFAGSALQYLQSQTGIYDSMLVAINLIPGMKDSLTTKSITLFPVTNNGFQIAFQTLNNSRKQAGRTPITSIKDLSQPDLDTALCKYIINGRFPTDSLKDFSAGVFVSGIKYNYQMNLQFDLTDASGYINGGSQRLLFSDVNKSTAVSNWQRAYTQSLNIQTSNAVIHPLVNGHDFDFAKFAIIFNK